MPRLCDNISGIKFYMYFLDFHQHHAPHFHAYYGDDSAVISLDGEYVFETSLPRAQMKIACEWAKQNQAALLHRWEQAVKGIPFAKIT